MVKIKTFKGLIVWQKSIDLVVLIYSITKKFPDDERFGLISQLRRAGVSVSSNIAEGFGRKTKGNFVHFLNISMGSLMEVETQLEISKRIGYIKETEYEEIYEASREVERLLSSLIRSIKNK